MTLEEGPPKPADFFIGLVDFFAVVLPGAILAFILLDVVKATALRAFPILHETVPAWIAFLISSYVLGHVLHHAGGVALDPLYDAWYAGRWKRRRGEERLLSRTRELMRERLGKDARMTSAYSWAGSYVRVHSASATSELERLGADSKFFRSLVLALVIGAALLAYRREAALAAGAALVAFFSVWRFCKRRWDASQTTYEYFILLSSSRGEGKPTPPSPR